MTHEPHDNTHDPAEPIVERKHTPTPWESRFATGAGWQIRGNPGPQDFGVYKFSGDKPVMLYSLRKQAPQFDFADETWTQFPQAEWDEMQKANAAFIVEAVNNYERLTAELAAAREELSTITRERRDLFDTLDAVIEVVGVDLKANPKQLIHIAVKEKLEKLEAEVKELIEKHRLSNPPERT